MKIINLKYEIQNLKQVKISSLLIEILVLLVFLYFPSLTFADLDLNNNILFRALSDELNRNITRLQLENQAKPFYIAYRVLDTKEMEIKASFGGLLFNNEWRSRNLYVDLRVGNYQTDNSNFICQVSGGRVIEADEIQLPVEDEYFALRQAIWLVTDGTYKKALEKLARKMAYLQNKQTNDTVQDFIAVKPCSIIEPIARFEIDENRIRMKVVEFSKVFNKYPQILESFVTFRYSAGNQYFLDNEGARNLRNDCLISLEVWAKAQANTGEIIEDFIAFYGKEQNDLDFIAIEKAINAWAETLYLKAKLKYDEEDYTGPVLFLGSAACEFFFQIFGKGVSDVRAPIYESEMLERNMPRQNMGILSNRLGRRVLPNFISVTDEPNRKEWNNIRLIGGFTIDDQGVRTENVELVRNGKLNSLLMSRTPVAKLKHTNGHARYNKNPYGARYTGFVSNLIITSEQKITQQELLAKLRELAQDYGNDYAIVITKIESRESGEVQDRYQRSYRPQGKASPILSAPANVYKLNFKTNSLELIKGLDFFQVTPGILRDIVVTGDTEYVYNFVYQDENGNKYPISVVAPAVLVEEMDLIRKKGEKSKLPIVPKP
ncbi:MAG: metallopeptidase TldD-related protein [bacterium]